jgi:hypothetical protein
MTSKYPLFFVASLALTACSDLATMPAVVPDAGDAAMTADQASPADVAVSMNDVQPTPADATPGWTPDVLSPMTPIAATPERWTWVPFPDSACGNGTPAGIGINLTTRSNRLVIYLQGGGACWDALTCHLLMTATNLATDYNETVFNREIAATGRAVIFNRTDMRNPYRDASYVYVPYCTGDIHSGNHVQEYSVSDGIRSTYHVGARNLDSFLRRLVLTFPNADRVLLTGISAGGFGAGMNWDRVARAFPRARVDMLDDSGPPMSPPATRFAQMRTAWNFQVPSECTACQTDLSEIITYYRTRFPSPARMAFLSYTRDSTITNYFGVQATQFEMDLNAMLARVFDPAPNFKYFIVAGTSHTMLLNAGTVTGPGGVTLINWLNAFDSDSPTWANVHP